MHISHAKDTVMHGSSFWVFFNKMNDNQWRDPQCAETEGVCQTNMAWVEGTKRLFWYSLSTKSTTNMIYDIGKGEGKGVSLVKQSDVPGSWGGVVAAYLMNAGEESGDVGEDSGASVLGVKGVLVLGLAALYAFWALM